MKFKIPPNSLFAILLRSSWWISFAIAGAIITVCLALLPKDIKIVSAMGSLPFVVTGVIALTRQWREPSAARTEQLLADAAALSSREFGQRLAAAWRAEGYEVQPLNHAAADWQLTRKGATTWVQAKRYKAGTHGVEPLRALHQAAQAAGAGSAYVLLQGALSEQAAQFAREQAMTVLQDKDLAMLLAKA
ncbi:MAG: restriction endonuclease [Comamonas sp.]